MNRPDPEIVRDDVRRALAEDIGSGDVTADLLPASEWARAKVITRETAILCGQDWFAASFAELDPSVEIDWMAHEGGRVLPGQVLCNVQGPVRALVSAERCALNFLQTLSATATATATHVEAIRGTRTTILDTRKTLPGLRYAQKYAVRTAGGMNHRMGLFDAILIKENHIAAAGSLSAAVTRARSLHPSIMVEVEVENFSELREALAAGADRIMLDEFELDELVQAVVEVDGRVPLEVSGGVGIDRVRAIAETGVDYISIGALTKHVRAIDLSMRIELVRERA
ncbi:carboxylating nicotinate-nucleotide diphosphorylase [Dokdonella immobilis]|uniref:Probable nicotinate-nucleotide pyrophosphorylase [carboxylating] n=1 Tax=Dokdonella immobilis TaxID=578942 RepID=A0A1I4V820_9GAMM|nr:carboxylating nicotinate-nucleotide diphosphorylase [Dokdonella immobilis]SFM97379.1 nicotinate-nucleotide pyrophosphorylase [carboxylating] [Dokdonella immobilis]